MSPGLEKSANACEILVSWRILAGLTGRLGELCETGHPAEKVKGAATGCSFCRLAWSEQAVMGCVRASSERPKKTAAVPR